MNFSDFLKSRAKVLNQEQEFNRLKQEKKQKKKYNLSDIQLDLIHNLNVLICDELNIHKSCIVEKTQCHEFLLRWSSMLKNNINPNLTIVYHWTFKENFFKIISHGLQVPRKGKWKKLKHKTDSGFFGKGIYTSPHPTKFKSYGDSSKVFICLSLPGRQYVTTKRITGRKLIDGYDSHCDGSKSEWVFFDTNQLLLCYLINSNSRKVFLIKINNIIKMLDEYKDFFI